MHVARFCCKVCIGVARQFGYAGALRRGELAAVAVEDVRFTNDGLEMLLPRGKTDAAGEGACRGAARPAGRDLPGRVLSGEAVRLILARRAAQAGISGTGREPVSLYGLRAGFVTQV